MGVNENTLRILDNAVDKLNVDKGAARLALIGDLILRHLQNRKANTFFRKTWKEALSFDINGHADITTDLCLPIDKAYERYFDVLINGGTAEHVVDQEACFDNFHIITKPGSVLIHVAPEEGSFKRHCPYHYDLHFFLDYAVKYGYKILSLERVAHGK